MEKMNVNLMQWSHVVLGLFLQFNAERWDGWSYERR